ncbi:MAG: hypothetical protein NT034_01480 [Candidatus Magasanikbacteria bacterium]|nr:hypothetical protein [Candidatus Magasanikbacteria bacterium]
MNELENKIESRVMDNIKSGKVKLRSKYMFLAERLSLGSAVILSLLLAVLFFNLALFYLKASDNLGYLSFGSVGFFAFLESFPYLLVVSLIIFIFIAGFLFKKTDLAYHRPFGYLALGLLFFILLGGAALAFTDIAENIEQQSFESRSFGILFQPFLRQGMEDHQRGIVGRVVEIDDDYIVVQTTRAIEKVDLTSISDLDKNILKEGSIIIAIGQREGEIFKAVNLRAIDPSEMPMILRGIHRRFGPGKGSGASLPPGKVCIHQEFQPVSNTGFCQ